MTKPHGRKTKLKVGSILREDSREKAFDLLKKIPDKQLVGHLFSHFYHKNELIKFRSISAMGKLGARVEKNNMEKARIILRRIMWNLNDESGGIGWGSPEAMGEILSQSRKLALEFKSILFSYLDTGGNHIEHDMLQRGVLWGIGTYIGSFPNDLSLKTESLLSGYLHSRDSIKRGYAARALTNAENFDCSLIPESILTDKSRIRIFDHWNFMETSIAEIALSCGNQKLFA